MSHALPLFPSSHTRQQRRLAAFPSPENTTNLTNCLSATVTDISKQETDRFKARE
jgi:hypothetical protein